MSRERCVAICDGFFRDGFLRRNDLADPMAPTTLPELGALISHVHEILGDQTYDSLARKGETMTTAEMVAYAYDQIDQARTELNAVSK